MTLARLERFGLLLLSLALHGCGTPPPGASNLVLITVDSLRGDHFLSERAGTPLTPKLAAFAERAVVYTHASSVSHSTSPGTAGILTGLLPQRSGVVHNSNVLPEQLPTLPGILSGTGFETAAFVSNPILKPGSGFDRGFDTYERIARSEPHAKVIGSQVTRAALGWLNGVEPGKRFLLWAHYMEPHGPYEPPAAYLAAFPKEAFVAPRQIPLLAKGDNTGRAGIPFYQHRRESEPSRDGRDYVARYAAEVRAVDAVVGELLAGLEARGALDDSVVVLTSDHGEALAGEHGFYFSHGNGVTQDQVHVPLLLYYPGCEGGRVIARPVSTVDVLPTVLDLLGVHGEWELDGAHLLREESRFVVSQTPGMRSLREGSWKLIVRGDATRELVDLSTDPGETRDVRGDFPRVAERLEGELAVVESLRPLATSEQWFRHRGATGRNRGP